MIGLALHCYYDIMEKGSLYFKICKLGFFGHLRESIGVHLGRVETPLEESLVRCFHFCSNDCLDLCGLFLSNFHYQTLGLFWLFYMFANPLHGLPMVVTEDFFFFIYLL